MCWDVHCPSRLCRFSIPTQSLFADGVRWVWSIWHEHLGRPASSSPWNTVCISDQVKLHRRQKQNVELLNLLRDFKNQIELNCFIKRLQEFETVMILQFLSAILNMVIHGVIHEVRNGVRHGVISIVKSHSSLNSEMAPPLTTRQQGTELPGQLKPIGKRRDQSTSPTQGMTFKRNTFGLLSHVLCVFK